MSGVSMSRFPHIGNRSTSVDITGPLTTVTYHDTAVVMFNDVSIRLDTGGVKGGWGRSTQAHRRHAAPTTKERMNQAARQFGLGYRIHQRKFRWYVRLDWTGEEIPYTDNVLTIIRIQNLVGRTSEAEDLARAAANGDLNACAVLRDLVTERPEIVLQPILT